MDQLEMNLYHAGVMALRSFQDGIFLAVPTDLAELECRRTFDSIMEKRVEIDAKIEAANTNPVMNAAAIAALLDEQLANDLKEVELVAKCGTVFFQRSDEQNEQICAVWRRFAEARHTTQLERLLNGVQRHG